MAPAQGDKMLAVCVLCLIVVCMAIERTESVYAYSRKDILRISDSISCKYVPELLILPDEMQRTHDDMTTGARHDTISRRVRKRGKRAGLLVCFRIRAYHPSLPSLFLSNVR
jgi:hypothetical protein